MGKRKNKKSEAEKRSEFIELLEETAAREGEPTVMKAIRGAPNVLQRRPNPEFNSIAALKDAIEGNDQPPLEPKLRDVFAKAVATLSSNGATPSSETTPHGNKYDTKSRIKRILTDIAKEYGVLMHVADQNHFLGLPNYFAAVKNARFAALGSENTTGRMSNEAEVNVVLQKLLKTVDQTDKKTHKSFLRDLLNDLKAIKQVMLSGGDLEQAAPSPA